MKKKNLILIGGAAVALSTLILVPSKTNQIKSAKAEEMPFTETIYLRTEMSDGYITTNVSSDPMKLDEGYEEHNIRDSTLKLFDDDQPERIIFLDNIVIRKAESMFEGLGNLKEIQYFDKVDFSYCNSFDRMFYECEKLTSVDFSSMDTSFATSFKYMFGKTGFTSLDLDNFVTNRATNLEGMFYDCRNLESISLRGFTTINVTSIKNLFCDCKELISLDLSNFNLSNVIDVENALFGTNQIRFIKSPICIPTEHQVSCPTNYDEEKPQYYDEQFNAITYLPCDNKSHNIYISTIKNTVESFAKQFNDRCEGSEKFDALCSPDGNTNISALKDFWSIISGSINIFDNDVYVIDLLKTVDTSNACEEVANFAGKYDYIYRKYSSELQEVGGDFLKRNPLGLTPGTSLNVNRVINTSDLVLTLSVASIALILGAVGISFASKKKKYN